MLKIFKWVVMSKEYFNCVCSEKYNKGYWESKKSRYNSKVEIINMLEDVDTWDKNLIKDIQRLVGEL